MGFTKEGLTLEVVPLLIFQLSVVLLMSTMIATSSTLFETTTGFTYASLVEWSGDIILLILGGGLGLINALIGWIIALAIIYLIIHLIRRGLGFLHILGR